MDKPRKSSNQEKNPENISRSTPMHDPARPMQGSYASTVFYTIWHMAIHSCTPYTMLLHHAVATSEPLYSNLQPYQNAKFLPKNNCI